MNIIAQSRLFFLLTIPFFFTCTSGEREKNTAGLIEINWMIRSAVVQLDRSSMANYDKIKRWEAGDRIDAKDYERLLFVRKMVQEMRNYLRSTGSEMISRIEGIDQRAGDTLHLVYLTDPMNTAFVKAYMIDEGTALMLKDKMIELEKVLINAPGYKQNDYYRKVANNMTNYEEMNGGKKWEVEIFSEKSLLETLTILESLDLRIVSAENQILQDYILVKETEIASDTLIK